MIGSDALKPWKMAFDQHAGQVYLLGGYASVALRELPVSDGEFKPGYYGELHRDGVHLLEVDSGGAFDQAGLKAGDVISTVEGFDVVDWLNHRVPPEIITKSRLTLTVQRRGRACACGEAGA